MKGPAASRCPGATVDNDSRPIERLTPRERLNFLLTNRIPRRWANRLMARFSRVRNPFVVRASIAVWRLCGAQLDLHESRQQRFASLHELFTRELKPGARAVDRDPAVLPSPCDGIVGACGRVSDGRVYQAKGFPYGLAELLGSRELTDTYRHGVFVSLRLKPDMYHRFHSPLSGRVVRVTHIAGDTWNVNPVAVKCIERLYCKNERAVIELAGSDGTRIALVAVAAILVASIRLSWLPEPLNRRFAAPASMDFAHSVQRGQELGNFEHGSTIIVFAPPGFDVASDLREGRRVRMGEALLRRPSPT